MSAQITNLTPAHKAEAWKFTSKALLAKATFQKPSDSTLEEFKKMRVALGPSAHQFEAMTLSDLEDSGYFTIEESSHTTMHNKDTERAVMDTTISSLFSGLNNFKLTLVKNLPSNLWIASDHMRSLELCVSNGLHLNLCLFESNTNNDNNPEKNMITEEGIGFLYNFKLENEAFLELGVALNSSQVTFSQINVETAYKSQAHLFSLLSGQAAHKRLEVNVYQKQKESEVSVNGLSFAQNDSTLDFYSNVFHLENDQHTGQVFKTIGVDKGKSIFGGRIHLTESASGASVEQLNNNLLLGSKSSVDTQPELNIYQDNVKASHGATTSTIDEDHLFYFASRGFKPEQSKKMLLNAFCKDSSSNLKNTGLQSHFSNLINAELENVE